MEIGRYLLCTAVVLLAALPLELHANEGKSLSRKQLAELEENALIELLYPLAKEMGRTKKIGKKNTNKPTQKRPAQDSNPTTKRRRTSGICLLANLTCI